MKPNIMIILPWLPFPLTTGGNQGTYNSIDAIRYDANIFLLYHVDCKDKYKIHREELNKLWSNVTIIPFFPSKSFYLQSLMIAVWKKIQSIFQKNKIDSYIESEFIMNPFPIDKAFFSFIQASIHKHLIDIVQMEYIPTLSFVYAIPEKIKKIFVHHELRFVRNKLVLDSCNTKATEYYNYRYLATKDEELKQLSRYDSIITVSEDDSLKLKNEGLTNKIFASFSLIKSKEYAQLLYNSNMTLSFVGPETHSPNKLGLDWFLEHCWVELLKTNKCWHLNIIGIWSAVTIKKYMQKYPNINFLGFVEDLQSTIRGTIMIVPLTVGSGIRMKILEAVHGKVPFISTSVGIEGLPLKNGFDCYIEDSPILFAKKINALLDKSIQETFTENAFKTITNSMSTEILRKSRLDIYYKLLQNE